MEIKTKLSGYILAGGKSSRMGTDKAFLPVQEEPMLKRMIRLLEPFCQTIAISGENLGYKNFNLEMVSDIYSGCGPISGIISSLKHSSTEWNLIVSVDVPFMNEALILYLISHIGNYDCIIPQHEGGIEPLMGLYNKQIIPVVEEMISRGDYQLKRLLSSLNIRYVNCNDLIKQFPRLFVNINLPGDYNSI